MIDNIYEKAQILQFCIILFMIEYSNQYTINNEKIQNFIFPSKKILFQLLKTKVLHSVHLYVRK